MSKEPPVAPDQDRAPRTTRNGSRRRFVQGVGVLVPTILTVASRSTLAASCLSASATASIDLLNSRPDRPSDGVCIGRSPGYWKNHTYDLARRTRFSQVYTDGFPGKSMQDAVGLTGNGNHEALARHLAAAWCNLKAGLVSTNIVREQDLVAMWLGRNGTYAPIAGGKVFWDESRIVEYLKTTMI